MASLTKEEYARLHLKAKRGMLTAEERAALVAYVAAAQPAPQTPVPADTETLLCCPYCGHATKLWPCRERRHHPHVVERNAI